MGSWEQGWYPPGIAHRHHRVPWGHPTAPPTGTSPAPWGVPQGGKTGAGGDTGATPTPLLGPVAPVPFVLPAPCWCLPLLFSPCHGCTHGSAGTGPPDPCCQSPPRGARRVRCKARRRDLGACPQFPHPAAVAGARVPWVPPGQGAGGRWSPVPGKAAPPGEKNVPARVSFTCRVLPRVPSRGRAPLRPHGGDLGLEQALGASLLLASSPASRECDLAPAGSKGPGEMPGGAGWVRCGAGFPPALLESGEKSLSPAPKGWRSRVRAPPP